MFKQKYTLDVKSESGRLYRFECEPDAPMGEMHDALHTMKSVVVEHIRKSHEKDQPEKEWADGECKKEETA